MSKGIAWAFAVFVCACSCAITAGTGAVVLWMMGDNTRPCVITTLTAIAVAVVIELIFGFRIVVGGRKNDE